MELEKTKCRKCSREICASDMGALTRRLNEHMEEAHPETVGRREAREELVFNAWDLKFLFFCGISVK